MPAAVLAEKSGYNFPALYGPPVRITTRDMSRVSIREAPSDQMMMSLEKGERPSSPVHLHVDDQTPVHVHVKKPKKPHQSASLRTAEPRVSESKVKAVTSVPDSNLKRSTSTAVAKSRSKSPGPWVPPPGKTTKGTKYSWQGPAHRLEISALQDAEVIHATLKRSDLDTDDEDRVNNKMRNYEKKIDSLMSEVGTLKNEVELQRTLREVEEKEEMLDVSRRALERQEEELDGYKLELEASESANSLLRRSMGRLRDDQAPDQSDREWLSGENDMLMKKLVEVEMDGQAAAKQVAALRDAIRRLKEEKRMSSTDYTMLTKQKELLMERLTDFENTNRTLRRMLRERHEQEAAGLRLADQRELLLKKLAESEDAYQKTRLQLIDRDRELSDSNMKVNAQREENMAINGLQSSLESTRAHLQKQLRQKDADCNRQAVQIRSLESQLAQERIDVDHLRQLVTAAKEKADRDKEALKKATRVQKQRATKSEDAVEQLRAQMLEREAVFADMRTELDGLGARCDKLTREKAQALAENSGLNTRVGELEHIMERLEDDAKARVEDATAKLHGKTGEAAALKLENERLKTSLTTIEDKLTQAEGEVSQLRGNLRQYESLVDEYRAQMNRSRREADESMIELEDQRRESDRIKKDGDCELDQVKSRLQARLQELEPIPELLKTTELKLQDASEKLLSYEKRNTENTKLIAELTSKVESQNGHVSQLKERVHSSHDDNRVLLTKLESIDSKLGDVENQNKELLSTIAKREETVHQLTMRLDEKTRENDSLSRQLEAALTDTRRQSEQLRDKLSAKDRAAQTRVLDLESQLSQTRADIARLKREKEEAERKFNSRLYDLKDRLEQSHSTNRSMQNYVQFLKNSYANVFGDSSMVGSSSPIRSTFH